MKTIWIILIICVVVAVLCALAWCCHLFAGNKEYNDTRQRYIQTDLEIGLVEPAKPDRYISQPRTLRVKRLPHNFDGIPMILQRKHFTEPPITPIKKAFDRRSISPSSLSNGCQVVWWQLWNFIVWHIGFKRCLH